MNRSIDEVFLNSDGFFLIKMRRDEGKYSVYALQCFHQFVHFLVIDFGPRNIRDFLTNRNILRSDVSYSRHESGVPTLRVSIKMSCFFVATRTSIISCATSANVSVFMYRTPEYREDLLPVPPAIAILTIFGNASVSPCILVYNNELK